MREQISTVDGLKNFLDNEVFKNISVLKPFTLKKKEFSFYYYFDNERYYKRIRVLSLIDEVLEIIDFSELSGRGDGVKERFVKRYVREYIITITRELLLDNLVYIGRNFLGLKLFTSVKYYEKDGIKHEEKKIFSEIIYPKKISNTKTVRLNLKFKKYFYRKLRELKYIYNYNKIK